MKKAYVTPEIERIEFQYRDQVVVASAVGGITTTCSLQWYNLNTNGTDCYHNYEYIGKEGPTAP